MLSSFFGLLSTLTWGAGDFAGGMVSRRAGVYRAAFFGESIGLALLVVMLAVVREPIPDRASWIWSAAAGASGSLGLILLLRALAEGLMSIAAPVSALMVAVLPVIASALIEGLPGPLKYLGFGLALLAIWLISRRDGHSKELHLADLRLPLLAGVCFGFYFILMHQGSRTATVWPMIAARFAGSIVLLIRCSNKTPVAMARQKNCPAGITERGRRYRREYVLYFGWTGWAAGCGGGNLFALSRHHHPFGRHVPA